MDRAQDYSRANQPRFPERDDTLPHQIRHLQYSGGGGLGVTVGCACTTGPLIPGRPTTSEDDAWEIYDNHLIEIDRANGLLDEPIFQGQNDTPEGSL
jgi:hypothetical protein